MFEQQTAVKVTAETLPLTLKHDSESTLKNGKTYSRPLQVNASECKDLTKWSVSVNADCRPGGKCRLQTRGKMQTEDKIKNNNNKTRVIRIK